MPLVDKLLAATIKYLQRKQQALRRKSNKKRAGARKKKPNGRKLKGRPASPQKANKKTKLAAKVHFKPALKNKKALATVKKLPIKAEPEKLLGVITHYFSRIEVVVIKLSKAGLRVGDTIRIKGSSSDFKQRVKSLQIESVDVVSAKKGDLVGLKVVQKPKVGDKVYFVA